MPNADQGAELVVHGRQRWEAVEVGERGQLGGGGDQEQAEGDQPQEGAQGVAGVKVKLEGDGKSRRVVFTPDKPTPMPKRALPVHDDEA